jgi:hypothetical protein
MMGIQSIWRSPRRALVCFAILGVSGPTPADIIWDNHLVHDSELSGRAIGGDAYPVSVVADNFGVSANVVIDRIRFETIDDDDLGFESVDIWAFDDPSGDGSEAPTGGIMLGTFPAERINTGRRDRARFVYRYTVELSHALKAGSYFLGLHANEERTSWWSASSGGQGFGTPGWMNLRGEGWEWEGWFLDKIPWDHAFEIHGEPAEMGTAAVLTDFAVEHGQRVAGGLVALAESDDTHLVFASHPFHQLTEPNLTMWVLGAVTDVENPRTIDIRVEVRLNLPEGKGKIALRSWTTGEFDEHAVYDTKTDDEGYWFLAIPAADYVRDDGRIEARLKTLIVEPIAEATFFSRFDNVQVRVKE